MKSPLRHLKLTGCLLFLLIVSAPSVAHAYPVGHPEPLPPPGPPALTATRVYGQNGDFSSADSNKGGISAKSLSDPLAVALDSRGDLYVAAYDNSRVLYYPAGSATATRVYGQAGSFSTIIVNKGGISAKSLSIPEGLALDGRGNLYVADTINNRVLMFPHT